MPQRRCMALPHPSHRDGTTRNTHEAGPCTSSRMPDPRTEGQLFESRYRHRSGGAHENPERWLRGGISSRRPPRSTTGKLRGPALAPTTQPTLPPPPPGGWHHLPLPRTATKHTVRDGIARCPVALAGRLLPECQCGVPPRTCDTRTRACGGQPHMMGQYGAGRRAAGRQGTRWWSDGGDQGDRQCSPVSERVAPQTDAEQVPRRRRHSAAGTTAAGRGRAFTEVTEAPCQRTFSPKATGAGTGTRICWGLKA